MIQLKTVVMVTVVTVVSVLTVTVVIVTVVRVTLVTIAVVMVVVVTFFSKDNLTPPKPMRFLRAAFRDLAMFSRCIAERTRLLHATDVRIPCILNIFGILKTEAAN